MNHLSIPAKLVKYCVKEGGAERPGDFCFDEAFTYIYVWLPGTSGPDALRITRESTTQDRVWNWNGDVQRPTLTPSILSPGQWHGYLTDGYLKSC